MDQLEKSAKAAYETESVCAGRIPWAELADHWKEYWRKVAKAVLSA